MEDQKEVIDAQSEQIAEEIKKISTVTSVRILVSDWEYCKKHGLQFSELLRLAISQKRAEIEGYTIDNVREERRKKEAFHDLSNKLRDFLEDKGLIDEFWEKNK